jgi:hypothetical protein
LLGAALADQIGTQKLLPDPIFDATAIFGRTGNSLSAYFFVYPSHFDQRIAFVLFRVIFISFYLYFYLLVPLWTIILVFRRL